MAGRRRISITVETDSVLLIRSRRKMPRGWCAKCAGYTEFMPLQEARALMSSDAATLSQLIDSESLHLSKDADQPSLVCFLSILKYIPRL